MPRGQRHTAYLTMYREEARMYSRTAIKTAGGVIASTLTANNQMTRKPNLALNAEIVRSGRAANCATTTARDPEIIDPITVECVKWLERNTETLRSGAAWDKRSREQLAIAIAGSTVRRKNRSKVRQAVAGRIKAELTAYGFKFPGCDL